MPHRPVPHRSTAAPFVALSAWLIAAPHHAAAQALLGRVVESPGGRPLGGLPVRLYRAASAEGVAADSTRADSVPVASTVSAADGVFALAAPGPGTYRVRVGAGAPAPAVTLAADSTDQREYAVALDYAAPLYPAQVDTRTRSVRGTVMLRYPTDMVEQRVTGCASVELVVDPSGRAEPRTVHVLAATRREFARAAADAVATARYEPAVRDGRPVRAFLVVPLAFVIDGQRGPDLSPCAVGGGIAQELVQVTAMPGVRTW